MSNKNELLRDINSYLGFEEELISKLAALCQKACMWRDVVKQEYHKDIEKNLEILTQDTEKHQRMLKDMTKYIEGLNKDEF